MMPANYKVMFIRNTKTQIRLSGSNMSRNSLEYGDFQTLINQFDKKPLQQDQRNCSKDN